MEYQEVPKEYQQTFRCGSHKYYVTGRDGYLKVRRQDWLEKVFIGYVRDIAEAMILIRKDSGSAEIRAA